MDKSDMVSEAIERLGIIDGLGGHENVLAEYKEDGQLYYTEHQVISFLDARVNVGVLYWIDNEEELAQVAREVEERWGVLVYYGILTNTSFGRLFSLLYISKHEEEWQQDRMDLAAGEPMAFVCNLDNREFSEFGHIGVAMAAGGLVRVA